MEAGGFIRKGLEIGHIQSTSIAFLAIPDDRSKKRQRLTNSRLLRYRKKLSQGSSIKKKERKKGGAIFLWAMWIYYVQVITIEERT